MQQKVKCSYKYFVALLFVCFYLLWYRSLSLSRVFNLCSLTYVGLYTREIRVLMLFVEL
jgi:hypothetical protein